MSAKKYLKKIYLESCHSRSGDVYLFTECKKEDYLLLKILDIKNNEAYAGSATDFDLRIRASNIGLTKADYMQKTSEALFEKDTDNSYLYIMEKQNEQYVFKWESVDHEETIIILGSVQMQKEYSASTFMDILQLISDEMFSLNSKVEKLSAELNEAKSDNSDALMQLSLAIDAKDSLEKELYAKFLLVLNTKKRRIKELQQKCDRKYQPQPKKNKTSQIVSSDSSDVDGELDINKPGPSSKILGRDSLLFLEEDKPVIPVSQNRIRNRKVAVAKKTEVIRKVAAAENPPWATAPDVENEEDSDDLLKCL